MYCDLVKNALIISISFEVADVVKVIIKALNIYIIYICICIDIKGSLFLLKAVAYFISDTFLDTSRTKPFM